MSINHVVLAGNLTRDPELRVTPSGQPVLEFGLAVNDRVKDHSSGEWTDRANFFDVSLWGRRGEALADVLARGAKVAISGRLRWVQWEARTGEKRSRVTVVAEDVELMQQRGGAAGSAPPPARQSSGAPGIEDDDDIPF